MEDAKNVDVSSSPKKLENEPSSTAQTKNADYTLNQSGKTDDTLVEMIEITRPPPDKLMEVPYRFLRYYPRLIMTVEEVALFFFTTSEFGYLEVEEKDLPGHTWRPKDLPLGGGAIYGVVKAEVEGWVILDILVHRGGCDNWFRKNFAGHAKGQRDLGFHEFVLGQVDDKVGFDLACIIHYG